MLYMPIDLFTPYINGRQNAINQNWNDLNQFNTVQSGGLTNEAQQLKNWFTQDTYGDRLSDSAAQADINQNKALGTDLQAQIAQTGQPGAVAQAGSLSAYQQALADQMQPYVNQIAGNQVTGELGQSADVAARGQATSMFAPQVRQAQIQNNLTQLQDQAQLFPAQTQTGLLNQQAQQKALENFLNTNSQTSPVNLLAPTPTLGGVDAQSILNVAGRLSIGQQVPISVNGQVVQAGRDAQGVYYLDNSGAKQYVTSQLTSTPVNSLFGWGQTRGRATRTTRNSNNLFGQ